MKSREITVGYCKPPMATRFRPGQSGNPNGRPQGTRNLRTDLEEELRSSLVVHENGKPKRISKQRAAVKVLTEKALRGDLKAIGLLLGLLERVIGRDQPVAESNWDPVTDHAILRRALTRLRNELDGTEPQSRLRKRK